MTRTRHAGAPGTEHTALTAVPDRPEAHARIAASMVAAGLTVRAADRLAADTVRALLPLLDDVDEAQGPANSDEDNYPAGWHGAVDDLRVLLVGSR